jgi:hypothetical protein
MQRERMVGQQDQDVAALRRNAFRHIVTRPEATRQVRQRLPQSCLPGLEAGPQRFRLDGDALRVPDTLRGPRVRLLRQFPHVLSRDAQLFGDRAHSSGPFFLLVMLAAHAAHSTRPEPQWDVQVFEDGELLFTRRCANEEGARDVWKCFRQDTLRAGWIE